MTAGIPLNIFQKLMRRWDTDHPYNAAQIMKIAGSPDRHLLDTAWQQTLLATGLGAVAIEKDRYRFESLNGHAGAYSVRFPSLSLNDHVTAEMNRSFDDPLEPPFRPFVIAAGEYFYAGVVYQHWLADSASIRMLLREWFMRVYDPRSLRRRPLNLSRKGYWNTIGPSRGGWGIPESLLDMTRRHIRLRRVQKIDSTALSDRDTRFEWVTTPPGLIDRVRAAASSRKVKVNDIFLSALVEACAKHVPLQRRRNRTDVAVGSVVDLRPYCPDDLSDTFGLFLGFTNVIAQQHELQNFEQLLAVVSRQTLCQKQNGVAPASLMWIAGALVVGTLSKPGELYHFYRKELPLAGGISNVDLTRTWAAEYPGILLDYIRVSPTGPMTPLVVTTTTLGNQFHIGLTHRTGLISPERAAALAEMFVKRLESLS
jgi:hypothetical protein